MKWFSMKLESKLFLVRKINEKFLGKLHFSSWKAMPEKGEFSWWKSGFLFLRFSVSQISRERIFQDSFFLNFPSPSRHPNPRRTLSIRKRSQNASQGILLIRFHPGVGSLCAPFYRNNYEMPLNTLAICLACKYTNTPSSSQLGIYVCREPVRCNLFVQIKGWFLHVSRN